MSNTHSLSVHASAPRRTRFSYLSSIALAVALAFGSADCSPPESGANSVAFHGEQQAFQGFSFDTGYLPAGSPIQVRILVNSAGGNAVDARATRSGGSLTGNSGSGQYVLGAHFTFQVMLKVNIEGALGHNIMYEGPLQGAPAIDFAFGGRATFDPFLVGGNADVHATVPETMLVTIPLAASVPVPGVSGDLIISISGTVNSSFSGVCASTAGSGGQPEYVGQTTSDAMLSLRPTVRLQAFSLMRTLDPFAIPVNIPSVTTPMTLSVVANPGSDAGPAGMSGGGSTAQTTACGAVDGGMNDVPVVTDGAPPIDATDVTSQDGIAPGGMFSHCGADPDCSALGANARCLTFYPEGMCTVSCTTDTDCPNRSRCYNNSCRPSCDPGQSQCDVYGGICGATTTTGNICYASCFPAGTTAPAGYPACPASLPCLAYTTACGDTAPTGGDVGAPCTMASDCKAGCYPEVIDGTPTGFVGGYCIATARQPATDLYQPGQPLPQSNCPSGSAPYPSGGTGDESFCLVTCRTSTGCRNGYACMDIFTGAEPASGGYGFCLPLDCNMTGMTCPSGYHCVVAMSGTTSYGTCVR